LTYNPTQLTWLDPLPLTSSITGSLINEPVTNKTISTITSPRPGYLRLVFVSATAGRPDIGALRFVRHGETSVAAIQISQADFLNTSGQRQAIHTTMHFDTPLTLPTALELYPNFPNPFNPQTTIRFALPAAQDNSPFPHKVYLRVFDTLGRVVRTLVDAPYKSGTYTTHWDGRDNQGRAVASGVYFYRLESGLNYKIRRLTLISSRAKRFVK
jgi:hypothetical protein